jgi:hypothetical protein
VTDIGGRLAALTPAKRALLEQALLERRQAASAGIGPRDRTQPTPLSSSQQRLWFFDQLTPGAPTYNAVVALWVRGDLDIDALRDAVTASIERHEVLRTVIDSSGDEPVQLVLEEWQTPFECVTADGDTAQARIDRAIELAVEAARAPYDLARDVTLRVLVADAGADLRLVTFLEHHISFDGWSDDILFAEISEFYRARAAGLPAPAPSPLPAQYADFALWQRRRLDAGDFDAQADHWKAVLAEAPQLLALPLDHERPSRQTFAGRHLPLLLPHGAALRALRQQLGATDFVVLVAAFAVTLYRWSGQSDVVLGTPMANRNRVEVESLIGFFSNTVPLRVRVDGAQSFRALVQQVAGTALDALDHQDLPFEKIVEAVDPVRDPRVNPLFQVNVRVQSAPPPTLDLPGLDVEPVHLDLGFSRFDLAIEFQTHGKQIGGYLEYNSTLIEEPTALALIERLDTLLGAALSDPDRPVWDLPQPSVRGPGRRRSGA